MIKTKNNNNNLLENDELPAPLYIYIHTRNRGEDARLIGFHDAKTNCSQGLLYKGGM